MYMYRKLLKFVVICMFWPFTPPDDSICGERAYALLARLLSCYRYISFMFAYCLFELTLPVVELSYYSMFCCSQPWEPYLVLM